MWKQRQILQNHLLAPRKPRVSKGLKIECIEKVQHLEVAEFELQEYVY